MPDDLYKQWVLEELDIIGEKRHGLYKPEEVIGQRNFIVNAELDYNEDGTFNFSNSWQNTQNSGKFVPVRDKEVRIMIRGCKQYELSNHLGNVLVTVSDRKSSRASSATATLAEYYVPYVLTISDYYAFGSSIKERTVSFSATYRYGMNNQEREPELGDGVNSAEFWMYDGKLGRRWNVDPIEIIINSRYSCFLNNPILFADKSGLYGVPKIYTVENGDNLTKIAKRNGVSLNTLVKWNPQIKNINLIYVGDKINITDPNKALYLGTTGTDKNRVGDGQDSESESGSNARIPTESKSKELVEADMNDGESENIKDYEECNDLCIHSNFDKDWDRIKNAFLSKSGVMVSGLKQSENYLNTHSTSPLPTLKSEINNYFTSEMKRLKGDYSSINFTRNTEAIKPPYLGDNGAPPALKCMFGGTQQLDVYLTSISINNNGYTAQIKVNIYDDYGVSDRDIIAADRAHFVMAGCREGLVAMWILQHRYGYKPVTTCLTATWTVNGTFNE